MTRRQIEDQRGTFEDADFGGDAIDVEADDVSKLHRDNQTDEASILSEFGEAEGDVRMHFVIKKQLPNSNKLSWCMQGTKADLPIVDKLQATWGAGHYRIMIFKNSKLSRNLGLDVMDPPKFVAPVAPGPDPNLTALIEALKAQADARQQQKPMSIIEMATAAATVVTAIAPLLQMFKGGNSTPSLAEQLETLRALKDLTGEEGSRETSLMDVAKAFISSPMLTQMAETAAGAPKPALPAPRATPGQPTPEQVQAAQVAQLKVQLQHLITRAQKNSDPGLYAEVIHDNLPAGFVQMLCQPGAFDFLVQIEPAIGTYRPWFDALLLELANVVNDAAEHGGENPGVPQGGAPTFKTNHDPQWATGGAGDFESDGAEGEGG